MLPGKDPEVAAVLEDDFLRRGVQLLKGARATAIERDRRRRTSVVVRCDDGRVVRSSHAVLAIGSVPNSDGLGLDAAGVETDDGGYVPIDHNCVTNVRAHLRRRRRQRQAAAVVGGRRCRAARSPSG